jgi:formylglycine-generating enzyme
MAKKFWVLCAVIVFSVNLAYAGEGNTKVSVAPAPLFKDPATAMEFVFVKGRCYQMGNTFGDGGPEEKRVHEVCLDPFYMGKYEVTQGQWKKIMGSNPSVNSKCGDNCPVDTVSWIDVQNFISKLNSRSGGSKYRLPTEAEWEYAARSGGLPEQYAGGNVLVDVAWFFDFSGEDNYRWGAKPVGTKRPNGLGIFDMTGNVWEWTNDWYGSDYYSNSPRNNPTGPTTGDLRVLRGGSWRNQSFDLRTTFRNYLTPNYRSDIIGFRLLRMI